MVTINTTDDLLRLLDENPEFRDAVRSTILTEELMALPAAFGAFASEVRSDLNSLKGVSRSHTNDIGFLKGLTLEAKLYNRGPAYLATALNVYDITRIRVAERDDNSAEFNTQLRDALEGGVITMEEYNRVLRTDMIASGRRPGAPGALYAAIEASYAVNRADIRKVKQTKSILDKVFPDVETITALFYTNIQPFIENEAYEDNIHLIEVEPLE